MHRAHLRLLFPLALAACGHITDPTQPSGDPATATISGALSAGASVPANAHVALVWRTPSGLAVGADAPVIGGSFSMTLGPPPDSFLSTVDTSSSSSSPLANVGGGSGGFVPPSTGAAGGTSTNSGSAKTASVHALDTPSGEIAGPLLGAVAGFVVYVDANGNGALDVSGSTASSPDRLLGGASDLLLVYLRGGSPLDFERLADTTGARPQEGYDLALTKGKWVGLNLVDLTLSSSPQLPSSVCGVSYASGSSGSDNAGSSTPPVEVSDGGSASGNGSNGYPSPSDPNLECAADGRSYTYSYPTPSCPPPPPAPPPGLCDGGLDVPVGCSGPGASYVSLPPGPVPAGWPCPIPSAADASAPSNDGG